MKKKSHFKGIWHKKMPHSQRFLPSKTILQLLLSVCFLFCIQLSQAQETVINLKFQDTPLKEVFAAIEKQSTYSFIYNSKVIDVTKTVSIDISEKDITQVLDKLLQGTKISYTIVEKQIVLSEDKSGTHNLSPRKIKGKVTDENNEFLIGVSVRVKGTTIGAITDVNGEYSLEVPADADVLAFSYIGYNESEIAIGDKTEIDQQLLPDVQSLSEVVVIGYGSIRKKDLTGSIATIKPKDMESLPVPTIGDALQGRATGVQVLNSGVPGTSPTIVIRGLSSINDCKPLYVVDGVPVESGIDALNPNDIESMQVLKDASASAIYGARGAGGVIIITTKRGKSDKNHLNVNYFYSIQRPVNMIEMLNASEFATYSNEMLSNTGMTPNPLWSNPDSLGAGSDWLGELFSPAPMQSISLSYSGNSEKSNIYVSGNYLDQEGIIINTGYKRFTLQFNADSKIFDFLKFGTNVTLNHDVRLSSSYNIKNTMGSLPTQTIYNADGSFTNQDSINPQWYGNIDNPIGLASLNKNKTKGYNLIGSAFCELDILKDIHFKTNLGLQLNIWDERYWYPKHDWVEAPRNDARLEQYYHKAYTWLWDNTLTYNKTIDKHAFNLMAGISAQEYTSEYIGGVRTGFISENTQVLNAGEQNDDTNATGGGTDWALFSYFGRLNYTYDDKYLLTTTLRHDGSSRFGPGNRYGYFPSASVAWRISKESFFENLSFVNDLKLRVGYGETGNQNLGGDYPYESSLHVFTSTLGGQMVYPLAMPNYSIKWESVNQTNVGVDASILDNRVNLSVDGFVKNTTGMLVRGVVIITTGYDNKDEKNRPYINAGKMHNQGVEFSLETQNLTGDFKWNTSLNLTCLENKIVSLNDTVPMSVNNIDGNINQYVAKQMNGHPTNAFFGYVTDGIFQTQAEVNNSAYQSDNTEAGDIRFKDLNNDGVVNDKDRTFIGNPNPDLIFSLNNTFSYKGFDLNIYFQGMYGNDIFNANRILIEGMDAARNQSKEVLNRWTGEGTSNTMPRAVYQDPATNNRISDRYVEDGSYLRLETVSLGYTVPAKYAEKIKASSLRVYATAHNLYTWTKYKGIDPVVGVNGIDNNLYPLTNTISVGVNMSF